MDRFTLAGVGLVSAGLVGYVVGVHVAYPGRAFSITAIIVGVALIVITQQSIARADA